MVAPGLSGNAQEATTRLHGSSGRHPCHLPRSRDGIRGPRLHAPFFAQWLDDEVFEESSRDKPLYAATRTHSLETTRTLLAVNCLASAHRPLLFADWYRATYISQSVLGCLVLKFIGSSLVSIALGDTPSIITNPEYIISFLVAFCLVRSDSIEARELASHMRYSAPLPVALNLAAALYKMRALSHFAERADVHGPGVTLVFGTLAFSACNALMVAEAWLLQRPRGTTSGRPPAQPTPSCSPPQQQIPNLSMTLLRHCAYLAALLVSHRMGARLPYSFVKVIILGALFANYNAGLLTHDNGIEAAANAHAEGEPKYEVSDTRGDAPSWRFVKRSSSELLLDTLHLPSPSKRPQRRLSEGSASDAGGWVSVALLWMVGVLSVGSTGHSASFATARRAARPAMSLLRRDTAPAASEPARAAYTTAATRAILGSLPAQRGAPSSAATGAI